MLRKYLIRSYLANNSADYIIGHSSSMFIRPTILVILLLFVLYAAFSVIEYYRTHPILVWIFGGLALVLLIKHTIDFFNFYLDCLVLSPSGITLFLWEGLFEYKTDFFEWSTIETVMNTQDSIRDKIFQKGDISITINHAIAFSFEDVPDPKKMARVIQQTKEKHSVRAHRDDDDMLDSKPPADYSVLMEALGEVVQEYVQKKKKNTDDYDDY